MTTYTHPNGNTVTHRDGGILRIESNSGDYTYLTKDEVDALRDYLLAELGLWRDDETGLIVVTKAGMSGNRLVVDSDNPRLSWWRSGGGDDTYDQAVARYLATLTPPPREPKPGEVWRITPRFGAERNAIVGVGASGEPVWRAEDGWPVPISAIPADRRLLVEADGTVVAGDE